MAPSEGLFSIIQYVPDLDRQEGVNVGVVLFGLDSGRAIVAFAPAHDAIRRRFRGPALDDARLESAQRSLQRRLEAREYRNRAAIEDFIAREANHLVLLPPRSTLIDNPAVDVLSLRAALVDEPTTQAQATRGAMENEADAMLTPMFVGARVRWSHEVTVPVLEMKLRVNLSYRNGAMNYVKLQRFQEAPDSAMDAAQRLGVRGRLLHNHPLDLDGERVEQRLIVIAQCDDATRAPIRALLEDFNVEVVDGATPALEAFVARVRREAH